MSNGWIGSSSELLHCLRTMGAEEDEKGNIKIYGESPSSFMGCGDECVVSPKVMCKINGRMVQVCELLRNTSYGLDVVVI